MYRVFVIGPWMMTFGIERAEPVEEWPAVSESVRAMAEAGDAYGRIVATYIEACQVFSATLVAQMTPVVEAFAVFAEAAAAAIAEEAAAAIEDAGDAGDAGDGG